MRNVMRQCLIVSALLINTMSVLGSLRLYESQNGYVIVARKCQHVISDYLSDADFSDSNGVSEQSSVSGTPVLKPNNFPPVCQREDSLAGSDFGLSDCGTKAPSDCGTKAPSDCGTKAPSDCETRISDSDPLSRSLNAVRVMKSVTSRGSLNEFFDEHGNPIFYPTTPLTARGENSPLKSSSRRFLLTDLSSPKRP